MPLILNGTTGISGVDGSAGTPSYQGTDTNTGIFYPAADTLALSTSGSERLRIDSSGNVGIGYTDPATYGKLAVNGNVVGSNFYIQAGSAGTYGLADLSAAVQTYSGSSSPANALIFFTSNAQRMRIDSSGNVLINSTTSSYGTANRGVIELNGSSDSLMAWKRNNTDFFYIHNNSSGVDIWNTQNSYVRFSTNNLERMRITSGGVLMVGTTGLPQGNGTALSLSGSINVARIYGTTEGNGALVVDKSTNTNTTAQVFVGFTINAQTTASGQINANGASQAAFGTWSDRRLKQNIVDLPSQLDSIMALRPVEFDYIESEGGGHQISFIAQEFEEVYPDAVGERADGMKTLTGWGKTEARLVKAIQEQQAMIEELKQEVAALKASH